LAGWVRVIGGGTLGAVVTTALIVSAADTNPGVKAIHGAMTNALINPALRTLREKLIDIAVSFDYGLL